MVISEVLTKRRTEAPSIAAHPSWRRATKFWVTACVLLALSLIATYWPIPHASDVLFVAGALTAIFAGRAEDQESGHGTA